ncbi:MAG: monovalent cation/H+ antiporter subunit D family protein [Pseudomonadota bacterium]|jgi:multicomponent Na+:H+ antiporter subunit D
MITGHLPVIAVMTPLLGAILCVLTRSSILAWGLTLIGAAIPALSSLIILVQVLSRGMLSYHMGGWEPPWGIEFRIDAANAFVLVIVSAVGLCCAFFARKSVDEEIPQSSQPLFYTMLLLCLGGMLGVVATGDAFNLFVFLEISSLSAYVLVAMGAQRERRALTAAFNYLIIGTIGASFYVIGLGLIYMLTGTLNMADIAVRISTLGDNTALRMGFAFIMVGLSLKFAMFPLHFWLPNAYTFAPSVVTAFLAGTATKVALYAGLRVLYTMFSIGFLFQTETMLYVFLPLGLAAVFAASITAIFQDNVKRMLAYSSVAQMGYLLIGISLANIGGLMAAVLHLFNHAILKSGLFLAIGCVVYRTGSCSIAAFRGLGHQMPWTMAALVIGALGMIGMPATVGFTSKWFLVLAAIDSGWWFVALSIVAGSLLTLIYFGRIIEAAYLQPAPENSTITEAPFLLLLPVWLLMITSITFGINSELPVTLARAASQALFLDPHNGLPPQVSP